jgi:hypothetical protein
LQLSDLMLNVFSLQRGVGTDSLIRASLQLELLVLRQQLAMTADRDRKRLRFRRSERLFWVWLYRLWSSP